MSPIQAVAGNYTVRVDASDRNQPARTAGGSGTYSVVLLQDSIAPTAPTALTAAVKGKGVSLAWKASQDNVAVSGYRVFRNSSLIGISTSLSYVDGSATSGTYSYFVKAFDAAQNVSASSNTATATIGGGGGKGGTKP